MFELLLLIYLLPLIAIVALLLKLAIGLVRGCFDWLYGWSGSHLFF